MKFMEFSVTFKATALILIKNLIFQRLNNKGKNQNRKEQR